MSREPSRYLTSADLVHYFQDASIIPQGIIYFRKIFPYRDPGVRQSFSICFDTQNDIRDQDQHSLPVPLPVAFSPGSLSEMVLVLARILRLYATRL